MAYRTRTKTTPATRRTPTAFTVDPRPLVALDWSAAGIDATFDGQAVRRLPSVETLLADPALAVPHRLLAESSFESWSADRRYSLIAAIRAAGHELYVFRPTHTARARLRFGLEKSDANDARTIHRIAREGRIHCYPVPPVEGAWAETRERVNRAYLLVRAAGGKRDLVASATSVLGPYRAYDEASRQLLGNGKKYSESLLAAAWFAAGHATSRDTYERLLGLHGSAYPSLLRSEVHHHSFRHARKRGVDFRTYRRLLRRLYTLFKAARPAPAA